MLLNCGIEGASWVPWTAGRSNQFILKEIGPEYSLEGLMLKMKLQYFGHMMWKAKDPDAGKDWRQEEKGMTEDEIVGWHHWLNGLEFEQAPGFGDGQGNLACCSPWDHKELDLTERLNWIDLNPVLCDDLEVGIWEMGGSFKREEIYVYFWLIHIIWQKATHIVKQFFLLFSC